MQLQDIEEEEEAAPVPVWHLLSSDSREDGSVLLMWICRLCATTVVGLQVKKVKEEKQQKGRKVKAPKHRVEGILMTCLNQADSAGIW